MPTALAGERVDRVVALVAGVARSEAAELVAAGAVTLAGRPVPGSRRLHEGEVLDVAVPPRGPVALVAEPDVAVEVLFADESVIVADKPAGLVVHPGSGNATGTLAQGLLARYPDMLTRAWPDPERPGIVHRLDKGTSGVIVVARTPEALAALSAQLRRRTVERRYVALVEGWVESGSGMIDAPLGRSLAEPTRMAVRADGRRAVTRYDVLERLGTADRQRTLLSCRLETGRTHQIRVHLAAIGHPVVGDERYRGARTVAGRPFLHAAELGFQHPSTGEHLRFESPLPPDLIGLLTAARAPS